MISWEWGYIIWRHSPFRKRLWVNIGVPVLCQSAPQFLFVFYFSFNRSIQTDGSIQKWDPKNMSPQWSWSKSRQPNHRHPTAPADKSWVPWLLGHPSASSPAWSHKHPPPKSLINSGQTLSQFQKIRTGRIQAAEPKVNHDLNMWNFAKWLWGADTSRASDEALSILNGGQALRWSTEDMKHLTLSHHQVASCCDPPRSC